MPQFIAKVVGITLVASTAKTLLQIAPADANSPLRIKEVSFSFDGTTTSDPPVLCEVVRQSTAGTSSALTLLPVRESAAPAARATALQTFTAEPTLVSAPLGWQVSPAGGVYTEQFGLDDEPDATTNRIGLRCTPGSAVNGKVTAYIKYDTA